MDDAERKKRLEKLRKEWWILAETQFDNIFYFLDLCLCDVELRMKELAEDE